MGSSASPAWGRCWGVLLTFAVLSTGCSKKPVPAPREQEVRVTRVKSPSDRQAGAEVCDRQGQDCQPVAPGQMLARDRLLRTLAGGEVTLDLGDGQLVDMGSLSELFLGDVRSELQSGEFSLLVSPLVAKDSVARAEILAGTTRLEADPSAGVRATVWVEPGQTQVTLRQGQFAGTPALQGLRSGGSLRLTEAGAFRTTSWGAELAALPALGSQKVALAEHWSAALPPGERGLGTITARLPNTTSVRTGVRLKTHLVRVVIRDGFARTEVEEEFENTTSSILEGRYRFPVPGDARLSRLALWVGDKLIEGEVVERQRAAQVYGSIVDRPVPRDPALLEWVSAGEMALKIFPILPQGSRRVLLAYDQVLSEEAGRLRYVYPLSLGQGRHNPIGDLRFDVRLEHSQGALRQVRVGSYPATVEMGANEAKVTFQAQNVVPQDDFVLTADTEGQRAPRLTLGPDPDKAPSATNVKAGASVGEHFVLRLAVDLPPGTPRPSPRVTDRAFVIDVSHSQSEATIALQGALVETVLSEMEPDERFVLLSCDSACAVFRSSSVPAGDRLDRALGFLRGLEPGGSSDLSGALAAAAVELSGLPGGRKRQVVLMSDGAPTSGELLPSRIAERARSVADRALELRLIGLGRTVDQGFLRQLANALGATLDLFDSGAALEGRLADLSLSLKQEVIGRPKLVLPQGLRSLDAVALPALRLGQEVVVSGEVLGPVAGEAVLLGDWNGSAYHLVRPIVVEGDATPNPLVSGIWARAMINHLLDSAVDNQAEIVRISTRYRTMSPYASFLVLESEGMYRDFQIARATRSAMELDEWSAPSAREDRSPPAALPLEVSSLEDLDGEVRAEEKGTQGAQGRRALPQARPSAAPKKSASSGGASQAPRLSRQPSAREAFDVDLFGADGAGAGAKSKVNPPPPGDRRPRVRRLQAHLQHQLADDAWRTWGNSQLAAATERLTSQPESRLAREEFIRLHLAAGRFGGAQQAALEFFRMDPDNPTAHGLLAQTAVVAGDHELSRQLLDVRAEAAPRDVRAHAEAARAFDAVGDLVRACAHYRSLAFLSPSLTEAQDRATACWAGLVGLGEPFRARPLGEQGDGQLEVVVQCDSLVAAEDCPSPVVIGPDGSVVSPWTPGFGRSDRHRVSLVRLRTGSYFILVVGGAPSARGKVRLLGRQESRTLPFEGGTLHTVAKSTVRFY